MKLGFIDRLKQAVFQAACSACRIVQELYPEERCLKAFGSLRKEIPADAMKKPEIPQ